ncbi:MAG TPA: RICIN domain-containing protein [Arachnia sp.]|nr:RICIN domain-containing protein [Arachnia sp.]HMT87206.1 RICIN domain-containing protein [Arachnia sp.]
MKIRKLRTTLTGLLAAAAVAASTVVAAQAYVPTGAVLFELGSEPCLKGRGNCAIYPKAAQLPDGRLIVAFEKSTVVPETGSADRQTIPVFKSDDLGETWQPLSEVAAPAYLSDDPELAPYISNWTNPYPYVLPEDVGELSAGTLLLATVVSGDDHYFLERKAADPNWVPSNDGDRSDLAIALYASSDRGESWEVVNIIATGGWQGGSAGALGTNIAAANTHRQIDPLWEPHLMVHDGELVAYYSDENDYTGFDPVTGVPALDPENDTATDAGNQILVHKTWDGVSDEWSEPVVDVPGLTQNRNGRTVIGGGRPGMTTLAPTTDGKWMVTFEYFGGGANTRYQIVNDPLRIFDEVGQGGRPVTDLPVDSGSGTLATGGSPVLHHLPDGRILYNASGNGSVWINDSGRSDGTWKRYQTTLGGGYSRTLQQVEGTGRVLILHGTWGGPTGSSIIRHADIDFGHTEGDYYQLINRKTGQVIGTGGKTNDANLGNANVPDVRLEAAGATSIPETQYWQVMAKPGGAVTLLNKAGGRSAAIWTGNPTVGQRIGQWVDDTAGGIWKLVDAGDGYHRLQAAGNAQVYLTGASENAFLTLQNLTSDGSQEWQLVPETGVELDVATLTATRCVAGKVVLAATVENREEVPVSVTVAGAYGSRSVTVEPGRKVSHAFSSRLSTIPAGDLVVTSEASVGGETVTTVAEAPYDGRTC